MPEGNSGGAQASRQAFAKNISDARNINGARLRNWAIASLQTSQSFINLANNHPHRLKSEFEFEDTHVPAVLRYKLTLDRFAFAARSFSLSY